MSRILLLAALAGLCCGSARGNQDATVVAPFPTEALADSEPLCPSNPSQVVEIRASDAAWRERFVEAVRCPNTHVVLGPDIDMPFADYQGGFPIQIGECVFIYSVASFSSSSSGRPPFFECGGEVGGETGGVILTAGPSTASVADLSATTLEAEPSAPSAAAGVNPGDVVDFDELEVEGERGPGPARTPRSRGPVLRFNVPTDGVTFLEINCRDASQPSDGVRMSGFRIEGPDWGYQDIDQTGVLIDACIGVEISNMEFAGWGGGAIGVEDLYDDERAKETNRDEGRITAPSQVKIVGSFFHHNQHPSSGTHAAGYGVVLGDGAWAHISSNVFDFNRHAVATNGYAGGYTAQRNLVLKGGGYHGRWYSEFTHQFDVHGTDHCTAWLYGIGTLAALLTIAVLTVGAAALNPIFGAIVGAVLALGFIIGQIIYWASDKDSIYNCGYGGFKMEYVENAFQYHKGAAVSIRGAPRQGATFNRNIFAHSGIYQTNVTKYLPWTDYAILAASPLNIAVFDDNVTGEDSYGDYGVCDFDGDGIDDLFLATRATWWYSSGGDMHWSYLNAKSERLADVRLGYFDDDLRCDVLAETGGAWRYVSGGYGDWNPLGQFGESLGNVALGRFDVSSTDAGSQATKRTTHALRRAANGQWEARSLFPRPGWPAGWTSSYVIADANGNPATQHLQSSSKPFDRLTFGDFTGDGVTDVGAIDGGKFHISRSALGTWELWNASITSPLGDVEITNIDIGDNADDIFRLSGGQWMRSRNGNMAWEEVVASSVSGGGKRFVGRFGAKPGGATLIIDGDRVGHFRGVNEEPIEWTSVFPY